MRLATTVIVAGVASASMLGSSAAHAEARGVGVAERDAASIEVFATQPLAFVARGVSLSYERLVWPHLSVVGVGGLRAAATGDYDSFTWSFGGEVRYWPRSTAMRGLVIGAHVSAGHTSVTDNVMHTTVGMAWGLTQRIDVGYRFVIADRLALTPSLGAGVREDVDQTGRLATIARPAMMLGFELGWMRSR